MQVETALKQLQDQSAEEKAAWQAELDEQRQQLSDVRSQLDATKNELVQSKLQSKDDSARLDQELARCRGECTALNMQLEASRDEIHQQTQVQFSHNLRCIGMLLVQQRSARSRVYVCMYDVHHRFPIVDTSDNWTCVLFALLCKCSVRAMSNAGDGQRQG
jgi:chromosome segregation ATPase